MTLASFLPPLAGGLLIGLSAGLYLLLNGRIAGISGLIAQGSGLVGGRIFLPAAAFLLGIPAGSALMALLFGMPQVSVSASPLLLVLGGVLVGFGTRLGSGCTSGHGVCGLARLSPRSLAATLTFMGVAGVTVFILRHVA
ncbi:YeeE/YedE family protein [Rhizobium paknamense]|uniref:Membrane protein YedE/YeeE n=1 Tax=Rhizobium paknamense TaxID=1206817 RepID=A0ABU0IKZ9_9HYPH|nr:YeeE/YedE thiosulfate transporter family protein [Rhizobium paknamense]MDQ0457869.1 putative membrane protein YedE/YeeE [Rhizobium paknamense]